MWEIVKGYSGRRGSRDVWSVGNGGELFSEPFRRVSKWTVRLPEHKVGCKV